MDDITGLYDHGARSRNPVSTLWYGIDPLFEEYPDFSPYNYCAGNPVKLVVEDGREVDVCDGEESFTYDPSIKVNVYKGDNEVIKLGEETLNQMNSTKSRNKVLNQLCSSDNLYIIPNLKSKGTAHTSAMYDVNGTFVGTRMNGNGNLGLLEIVSHELFHSYQFEMGQGGPTIFNEIEAYTYQSRVLDEYSEVIYEIQYMVLDFCVAREGANKTEAEKFENAFKTLQWGDSFDIEAFNTAMNLFRDYSQNNADGTYNSKYYELKSEHNKEYIIKNICWE